MYEVFLLCSNRAVYLQVVTNILQWIVLSHCIYRRSNCCLPVIEHCWVTTSWRNVLMVMENFLEFFVSKRVWTLFCRHVFILIYIYPIGTSVSSGMSAWCLCCTCCFAALVQSSWREVAKYILLIPCVSECVCYDSVSWPVSLWFWVEFLPVKLVPANLQ